MVCKPARKKLNQQIILVTSRSFSSGNKDLNADLANEGFKVVVGDFTHNLEKMSDDLPKAVAWIAGVAEISDAHLDMAKNLKIIARYGVGVDAVDLTAAKKRGIIVTNTPGANSLAVAEHSLALLFASVRNLYSSFENVLANNWKVVRGAQISGSSVGVIGFGRIGRLVVDKLIALGAKVFVSDPFVSADEITRQGASKVAVEKIRDVCGFVLLQAPGGQEIIDATWVDRCKENQIIINTARADLVNENAIAEGLNSGKLNFYAADALRNEVASPLLEKKLRDKVLITPHIAAQTHEAIDQMGQMAVNNVLKVLSGHSAENPVQ